ncbi:hypothetical protein [Halorubrum halodurans]|uniref:Uncharacterized protein n=1 Tax=Halorubrum halodurans TaxID=1383851 RepID=A0A256IEL5_9EURY|nr:hypothetical protein [Halorubrum halodurans]OYR54991.1 hypothetical protein DJ70_12705 [Halorubrum halodurans]
MNPEEILRENAETYQRKNADYGQSWYAIGEILYGLTKGEPIALETPEDFVSFGLFTRRLDKLARAFTGEFLDHDLNFESIRDSHEDESTYAAIHASLFCEPETVEYVNVSGAHPEYEAAYQDLRAGEGD